VLAAATRPQFNGGFYAAAATIIPVLFLALAVQGDTLMRNRRGAACGSFPAHLWRRYQSAPLLGPGLASLARPSAGREVDGSRAPADYRTARRNQGSPGGRAGRRERDPPLSLLALALLIRLAWLIRCRVTACEPCSRAACCGASVPRKAEFVGACGIGAVLVVVVAGGRVLCHRAPVRSGGRLRISSPVMNPARGLRGYSGFGAARPAAASAPARSGVASKIRPGELVPFPGSGVMFWPAAGCYSGVPEGPRGPHRGRARLPVLMLRSLRSGCAVIRR
jgi:hypothetical protein